MCLESQIPILIQNVFDLERSKLIKCCYIDYHFYIDHSLNSYVAILASIVNKLRLQNNCCAVLAYYEYSINT